MHHVNRLLSAHVQTIIKKMPSPSARIFLLQVLFLVTGMISTLGAQWLKYRGAADSLSFLTVLSIYIGMSLVAVLPHSKLKHQPPQQRPINTSSHLHLVDKIALLFIDWRVRLRSHIASFGPVNHMGVMAISVIDVASQLVSI
jgi:hypothetical protein